MSDGDGAGGGKKRAREESELDAATSRCATEFIKINVGGKGYTALRSNLCADPNSMIAKLFSEDSPFGAMITDEEGRPYLDRDPEIFQYILAELRDPKTFRAGFGKLTEEESAQLYEEADFFGLQGLTEFIDSKRPTATTAAASSMGLPASDKSVTLKVQAYWTHRDHGTKRHHFSVNHVLIKCKGGPQDGHIALYEYMEKETTHEIDWNRASEEATEWMQFKVDSSNATESMVRLMKMLPSTPSNCSLLANWLLQLTKSEYCFCPCKSCNHFKLDFQVFDFKPIKVELRATSIYGGSLYPWQTLHSMMLDEINFDGGKKGEALRLAETNAMAQHYVARAIATMTDLFRSWESA